MIPIDKTCSKHNAFTSVDDLIKDIDENLCLSPESIKPTPCSKAQVDKILSVSDHSDTSLNVLSPGTLNYYINRFRNSQPTHPLNRPHTLHTSPPIEAGTEIDNVENCLSSSDCSNDTLTLDTSSYLDRILSSDDSNEWNFTPKSNKDAASNHSENRPGTSDCPNSSMWHSASLNPHQIQNVSFIEQLTGKTFSELSQIVPKEVINPTDESEDILYQWRLKKHITDAKNSMPLDDSYYMRAHETLNCDRNIHAEQRFVKPFNPPNLSKEIQTDAEKRESSCQVDIISTVSCRDIATEKTNVKVKSLNPTLSPVQDSCSDISISSISTDDLTNISDLDEEEALFADNFVCNIETNDLTGQLKGTDIRGDAIPANSSKLSDQGAEIRDQRNDRENHVKKLMAQEKCNSNEDNNLLDHHEISNEEPACEQIECSNLEMPSKNRINVEELLSYLDNIRGSFDDELLNVFIDRYQCVLNQICEIENEINRRCHED
jgi:hypothetical protein